MTWTSKKPTEPGFYFYHPTHADPNHIWIAQVTKVRDESRGLFYSVAAFNHIPQGTHLQIDRSNGMWSGPIPNPGPCYG